VKALLGEGGGSIPVAYVIFLLGRDFVWRCRHVWLGFATGARGTRRVWAGFAAGARSTVERGCDRDARPWIEAEDRRARAVQSIRTLLSLQRYSLRN